MVSEYGNKPGTPLPFLSLGSLDTDQNAAPDAMVLEVPLHMLASIISQFLSYP